MDEDHTDTTEPQDSGSHKLSAPLATATPAYRKLAKFPFKLQACQLCNRFTIYQTRSGLSDQTTVHHGNWYRTQEDVFVLITRWIWSASVHECTVRCIGATVATQHMLVEMTGQTPGETFHGKPSSSSTLNASLGQVGPSVSRHGLRRHVSCQIPHLQPT